jgi:serine/threonine-protein kinase
VSSIALASPARELVLGRYRAVRPLGSGGSGSVWLARDERTGLDVALKIIAREGKAAARAEREALAARRLRHDRCVRAYDVGHDSSHVYIAYEYVPGRTMREALRAEALVDEDAVEIAVQVLEALAHAHRAGIVHRDVKPSNILLEDRDELTARLLDFGLAQFDGADTLTAAGDIPGTLAYIAPERLAGGAATPESDVWSVGVLLWESLAARHPFWGLPLQEVARAIEAGAPPLGSERPDLPRRVLAAIDAALASNPEERPQASALAAELRVALRAPGRQSQKGRGRRDEPREGTPGTTLVERAVPALLAAATAAIGATLLPFWPPALVVAIVLGAGLGAAYDPRVGLAVALAAPVFPLGNHAQAAAVVYAALALCWLALCWSDARRGLLFVCGPLLAAVGALALVPLAVWPARGAARRAAQGGVAVLAAAVVMGIGSGELPPVGAVESLGIAPADEPGDVVSALWRVLVVHQELLAAAVAVLLASAVLPPLARRWRHAVAAVGATLTAGAVALAGLSVSIVLVIAVWAGAAAVAAGTGR